MKPTFRSALIAAGLATLVALPALARDVVIPFDKDNFSDSLDIDNTYFPLVPDTTYTYRAETPEGCEEFVIEVTSETKLVAAGVTARVVHEDAFEYENSDCTGTPLQTESTDDWFAQDDDDNVWYLGEDSRNCDENGCSPTPSLGSWEAGVGGAVAGIIMLADPRSGDEYQQEFAEGIAEDRGKVVGTDVWVSLYREDAVDPGEFQHCLKIRDSTPLEPGHIAYKYYCPDVGLVAEEEHHGRTVRFELVDISN